MRVLTHGKALCMITRCFVYPIALCLNSIPSSLTEAQKRKFLEKACPGKEKEIVHNISLFLAEHCPIFVLSLPKNEMEILAPPVADCLECGSQLVSYHSCDIKLYSKTSNSDPPWSGRPPYSGQASCPRLTSP